MRKVRQPRKLITYTFSLLCIGFAPVNADALESDPFLPRVVDRADAGALISARILKQISQVIVELNSRRDSRLAIEDQAAHLLRKKVGGGTPITFFEMALNWSKKIPASSREHVHIQDSIFRAAALTRPQMYFTPLASTIRGFGVDAGTDKYGHALQQGYDYFLIYRAALKKGVTRAEATARAVRFGQRTERTYWGNYISGVFSNADLAANFAGMRFYQNLTQPVHVGGKLRSPILLQDRSGSWHRNPMITDSDVFGVFVTDHWDELANPSVYIRSMDRRVRKVIASRCDAWRRLHPEIRRSFLKAKEVELRKWFGEDYGFSGTDGQIMSLAEICFTFPIII